MQVCRHPDKICEKTLPLLTLAVLSQVGFHARMFDHWAAKVVALGYSVSRVEEVRCARSRAPTTLMCRTVGLTPLPCAVCECSTHGS